MMNNSMADLLRKLSAEYDRQMDIVKAAAKEQIGKDILILPKVYTDDHVGYQVVVTGTSLDGIKPLELNVKIAVEPYNTLLTRLSETIVHDYQEAVKAHVGTLFGIKIKVDPSLKPGEFRLEGGVQ